jgi:tRNA (guanosine-2'-O-)-methyltransferase
MVESLNVSASAAILIYMLSQRMRLSEHIDWHLSNLEYQELMFRWVMSSARDAERVLERKFGK